MDDNLRVHPRIWDPGWLVLKRLAETIRAMLSHPALELPGAGVLDFGCGTRPYEAWFERVGARYHGADIDRPQEVAISEDGRLAAADGAYDMVTSFQVLEHVWDAGRYLEEARRVLKPGGWLLLSTHGSWFYHPHPGDFRRWTGEGLRREVEARGFRLQEMRSIVGPLAWTSILRCHGFVHLLSKLPVGGRALAALAALLFNLRAWIEDRVTPPTITLNNACVYVALFQRNG